MDVQVTLVRVHEPDAVRELIAEALRITAEFEADGEDAHVIFAQACRLLGERVPIIPQPMQIPAGFVLPPNAHGR